MTNHAELVAMITPTRRFAATPPLKGEVGGSGSRILQQSLILWLTDHFIPALPRQGAVFIVAFHPQNPAFAVLAPGARH
jgi:hypothetical protein